MSPSEHFNKLMDFLEIKSEDTMLKLPINYFFEMQREAEKYLTLCNLEDLPRFVNHPSNDVQKVIRVRLGGAHG